MSSKLDIIKGKIEVLGNLVEDDYVKQLAMLMFDLIEEIEEPRGEGIGFKK